MIRAWLYNLWIELKVYFRIPFTLFWVIFFPLLQLLLFGALFGRFGPVRLELGISDEDNSAMSREFVAVLAQVPIITTRPGTYDSLHQELLDQKITGIVRLPKNFAQTLAQKEHAQIVACYHPAQGGLNDMWLAILHEVVRQANEKLSGPSGPVRLLPQPVQTTARPIGYVSQLVPGLMGFCILSVAIFSIAIPLTAARERNYLKRISVTPIPKAVYLLSFVGAGWVIATVQSGVLLLAGIFGYQIQIVGSLWQLFLVLQLGIAAFMGIGLLVAAVSSNIVTANILGTLLFFPMIFLSEIYFPIANLPQLVKQAVACFPLIHFVHVLRQVINDGAQIASFPGAITVLLLWLILPVLAAAYFFDRSL